MPRLPKNQSKPYPSKVTKRIKVDPTPLLRSVLKEPTDEQKAIHQKDLEKYHFKTAMKATTEAIEKMFLLLDHYNIDRNDEEKWFFLAFNLARNHIEGFSLEDKKPEGSPKIWDNFTYLKLYHDVSNKVSLSPDKSIAWACRQLVKAQPWKDMLRGDKGKSLENQYNKSKSSPLVKFYNFILSDSRIRDMAPDFAELIYTLSRTALNQRTSQ